jgi:hypothetical protein
MSSKGLPRDKTTVETYLAVFLTFAEGYIRFLEAEAASSRLNIALVVYRSLPERNIAGNEFESVLAVIERIPNVSFESLRYVTNISHLVYATTLLDTFLTETTIFLFLLIPETMGKNQQVPLRMLIDAQSRNAALTQAAIARAREISYKSFEDRLEFLRNTFGLEIKLESNTERDLKHYSGIRNSAVHDQGVFELGLNDLGSITHRPKTCPTHPTPIPDNAPQNAAEAYRLICSIVAWDIFAQILRVEAEDLPTGVKELIGKWTNASDEL